MTGGGLHGARQQHCLLCSSAMAFCNMIKWIIIIRLFIQNSQQCKYECTVNEEKAEACSCSARCSVLLCLLAAFSKNGIDIVVRLMFNTIQLGRASFLLSFIKIYSLRTPPHRLATRTRLRNLFGPELAIIRYIYKFNWTATTHFDRT